MQELALHVGSGREIVSLATKRATESVRIVVGTIACQIICFDWTAAVGHTHVFRTDLVNSVPRALTFQYDGNVRVITLKHGAM